MNLAAKVLKGDVRATARLITLIEDEALEALDALDELYPHTGQAYIVGVTGAPGVGKSTLTDCLIDVFRQQKKPLGVIAIDPTSALTGGALLGDRIRMQRHAADPAVFIRSLATRGWMGGLAKAALGAVNVMDAMGKDIILLETVGSGQVELDIVKAADTTLLVLSPGLGDAVQTMKAGILESADVIAVNKADNAGADQVKADLEAMLAQKTKDSTGWLPPVIPTVALNGQGADELAAALKQHHDYLKSSRQLVQRRRERVKLELLETVEAYLKTLVQGLDRGGILEKTVDELLQSKTTPRRAAQKIITHLKEK